MVKDLIHNQVCKNKSKVDEWFLEKTTQIKLPFYTSVDVRDSGFKVVSVDANIYPAGFNNICQVDKDEAPELVKRYVEKSYGSHVKKIAILAEENSRNPYYWENMRWIQTMVQSAGFQVRVCFPKQIDTEMSFESSSGHSIQVHPFKRYDGLIEGVDGFIPDIVISNNDFSNAYEDWVKDFKIPINPPWGLGWHQRKKSDHFRLYNDLAQQFAKVIEVDPWIFTVETQVYSGFEVNDIDSREALAVRVDQLIDDLGGQYKQNHISDSPTVFIKNNSGTYGLGVLSIQSGDEIRNLNSKNRGKMNASKGGGGVTEVILQEGVPTALISDGEVAEPVVYIIGSELAGGFFRTHSKKGSTESLNSPGAIFKRMCVSDLKINIGDCPIENVYGCVGRLSSLAIGLEAQEKGIEIF